MSEPRFAENQQAAPIHRVRASAALTSFMNALTVSLFALVPSGRLAVATIVVAVAGLLFVGATLLSLVRLHALAASRIHEAVFLIGLAAVFVFQLSAAVRLHRHPLDAGLAETIAMLVVACFVIGIYRAWDLVGGPSFDLAHEVRRLMAGRRS
ncbi:hypothetical protein KIH74_06985 [Kineosporia sp. J2-2]|uniref:Uncharacterized protein n=1 Tax=Kineosporia corallincola TaxID=2835133 RepID=A0ABS5TC54_9ACTN|nr:hypothetical protein [Kineosporia corallincola]MBT0768665.1 hypothetical protein [Kineosporia corallincola]